MSTPGHFSLVALTQLRCVVPCYITRLLSPPTGPFPGFCHITAATGLTALSLAASATAAWNGSTAPLPAADLACVTALQLLQVTHYILLSAETHFAQLRRQQLYSQQHTCRHACMHISFISCVSP